MVRSSNDQTTTYHPIVEHGNGIHGTPEFLDDCPIKCREFPIAMLDYRRVVMIKSYDIPVVFLCYSYEATGLDARSQPLLTSLLCRPRQPPSSRWRRGCMHVCMVESHGKYHGDKT